MINDLYDKIRILAHILPVLIFSGTVSLLAVFNIYCSYFYMKARFKTAQQEYSRSGDTAVPLIVLMSILQLSSPISVKIIF